MIFLTARLTKRSLSILDFPFYSFWILDCCLWEFRTWLGVGLESPKLPVHTQRRVAHVGEGLTSWQRPPPLSAALVSPWCPGLTSAPQAPGTGRAAEGGQGALTADVAACLQDPVRTGAPRLPHPPLHVDTRDVLRCWHCRLLRASCCSVHIFHIHFCCKQSAIHVVHAISPRPYFFWKLMRTFNNWISWIRIQVFTKLNLFFSMLGEGGEESYSL